MAKEIGIVRSASKKAKQKDEKIDKKNGIKEGSPADLKADKVIMKKYPPAKSKAKSNGRE